MTPAGAARHLPAPRRPVGGHRRRQRLWRRCHQTRRRLPQGCRRRRRGPISERSLAAWFSSSRQTSAPALHAWSVEFRLRTLHLDDRLVLCVHDLAEPLVAGSHQLPAPRPTGRPHAVWRLASRVATASWVAMATTCSPACRSSARQWPVRVLVPGRGAPGGGRGRGLPVANSLPNARSRSFASDSTTSTCLLSLTDARWSDLSPLARRST